MPGPGFDRQGERGFLRVELVVPVVIAAVVAAIILGTGSLLTTQSRQSACRQDYQRIVDAEEAYYAQRSPASYALLTDDSSPLITSGLLHSASRWYRVTVADAHRYAILPVDGTCTAPPS